VFTWNQLGGGGRNLGLALTRDCNNARAFDTLLRYRGGALAEFWRVLRTLKALQAEQAQRPEPAPAPRELPDEPESDFAPQPTAKEPAPVAVATVPAAIVFDRAARTKLPDEPESGGTPRETEPAPAVNEPGPARMPGPSRDRWR
jgi:hypothetical protein